VTPLGIDPETSRLAAQYLNHYATPGPQGKGGMPFYRLFTIYTLTIVHHSLANAGTKYMLPLSDNIQCKTIKIRFINTLFSALGNYPIQKALCTSMEANPWHLFYRIQWLKINQYFRAL
jgi:hypothetical protein